MNLQHTDRCIASKASRTVIDFINPETGLTQIFGKSLGVVREEHPDAEEMSFDAFCEWKSQLQNFPIAWEPTTGDRFEDALNVLPPALQIGGGFLLGEPADHDAKTGSPRYQAFRQRGEIFEASNRPMTRAEFRQEMRPEGDVR